MLPAINNLSDLEKILSSNSITEVIYHYFLTKDPVCFGGDEKLIYDLKKNLSKYFKLHAKNIEIVGSAKLGISLNPVSGRFGKLYDGGSDIDLVVVSSELFDDAWHELVGLDLSCRILDVADSSRRIESYKNIAKGIISPDKLPRCLSFYRQWWYIFHSLSNTPKYENRKIRGRLFKDWWFVEKYYSIMLAKLSNK